MPLYPLRRVHAEMPTQIKALKETQPLENGKRQPRMSLDSLRSIQA